MTTEQPIDQSVQQPIPPSGGGPAGPAGPAGPGGPAWQGPGGPARSQPIGLNRLRRRTTDRVIGGVAGGLGDYLNVDPILIRVAFVGLMVFGGAGLPLYLLAWLLIPAADRQDSIAESALRRLMGRGVLVLVLILLIGFGFVMPRMLDRFDSYSVSFPDEVFWALGVALVGVLLLLLPRDGRGARRSGGSYAPAAGSYVPPSGSYAPPFVDAPPPAAPAGTTGADASAFQGGAAAAGAAGQSWTQPAAPDWQPSSGSSWQQPPVQYWTPPAAPAREPSPLGWYAVAGALLSLAAVAVFDTATTIHVLPAQYIGAGVLALGIGLLVGAWWGRARMLILAGLLVLPFAALSTFLTVPMDGGNGSFDYQVTAVSELQSEYRIATGSLYIDLSRLEGAIEPIDLTASVGIGSITVIVPRDANLLVDGTVQGGRLSLLGRRHGGTGLSDLVSSPGYFGGATVVLHVEAGLGDIYVERVDAEIEGALADELEAEQAQLEAEQAQLEAELTELEAVLQNEFDPVLRAELEAHLEAVQAELERSHLEGN